MKKSLAGSLLAWFTPVHVETTRLGKQFQGLGTLARAACRHSWRITPAITPPRRAS
ncbi:MAG: hypothetical protein HY698_22740 [Deltaproteobacteria bacterium]|nr:hypothetical protein [Deltaproteobacteria bacterium]